MAGSSGSPFDSSPSSSSAPTSSDERKHGNHHHHHHHVRRKSPEKGFKRPCTPPWRAPVRKPKAASTPRTTHLPTPPTKCQESPVEDKLDQLLSAFNVLADMLVQNNKENDCPSSKSTGSSCEDSSARHKHVHHRKEPEECKPPITFFVPFNGQSMSWRDNKCADQNGHGSSGSTGTYDVEEEDEKESYACYQGSQQDPITLRLVPLQVSQLVSS